MRLLHVRARYFVMAAAVGGLVGLAASTAVAAPALNVSFFASHDGASAGWSSGPGSPIDLTLGSVTATTTAGVTLHHLPAVMVSDLEEPTFSTDNYTAGSPRWYITLDNGDSLWGYPSNSGLNGTDFAWAINNGNTYMSWTDIVATEGDATVTGAIVVADGDQSPGTVDVITALQFNGNSYN